VLPRSPKQTSALVLALAHKWEPERTIVIYTAYIDASGHHDGSPVMILGGYVARLGQWANFDKKFERLLHKNNLTHHHTKKLIHGEDEYKNWSEPRKNVYINKLQKLIDKNSTCGFSISMTHSDYRQFYRNGDKPKGVQLDGKYGLCFRLFLAQLPNMFQRSLRDPQLFIVLEDGDPGIDDADRVFKSFEKDAPPELSNFVKFRGKAKKRDYYGLQIADWVAASSYHAEQGMPNLTSYPADATLQEASALVPYESPVFRWQITPDVMRDLKQRLVDHAEHRRQHWKAKRRDS